MDIELIDRSIHWVNGSTFIPVDRSTGQAHDSFAGVAVWLWLLARRCSSSAIHHE
jgi:hypothetical protein